MRTLTSGVPLAHYLDHHPGTDVALICEACVLWRKLPMVAVLARLEARGLVAREVGIRAIAGMVEGPCPRCGRTLWSTWPAFPSYREKREAEMTKSPTDP